jgi:hypothetical protein
VHSFAPDRAVFAVDHDEVGPGGGDGLSPNGGRNHAHHASQDAVIAAQPLLEEHRQSVAGSPNTRREPPPASGAGMLPE